MKWGLSADVCMIAERRLKYQLKQDDIFHGKASLLVL